MNGKAFSSEPLGKPDGSTLTLHKFLHDGKAHPATFNLIPGSEGLKHAEHAAAKLLRNPGAIIRNDELRHGALLARFNPDMPAHGVVVMLDRVADKILQGLGQRGTRGMEDGEPRCSLDLKAI